MTEAVANTYQSIPNEPMQMATPQARMTENEYTDMVKLETPGQFKKHIQDGFNLRPKGKYAFIIEPSGDVIRYTLTTHLGDKNIKRNWIGHTTLLNDKELPKAKEGNYKVKYAGHFVMDDTGKHIAEWSNGSGHFKPKAMYKDLVAEHWGFNKPSIKFERYGFDHGNKAPPPVQKQQRKPQQQRKIQPVKENQKAKPPVKEPPKAVAVKYDPNRPLKSGEDPPPDLSAHNEFLNALYDDYSQSNLGVFRSTVCCNNK